MPAALKPTRTDREKLFFTRASWADCWPNHEVICFSDPALQIDSKLNGAWFIHPEYDVIQALSQVVQDISFELGIEEKRIVVYGSSLGGFGALMLAACFKSVRAVAEVPQLEFRLWQRRAVADVEKYIIGRPISEFRTEFPERVSVLHRFIKCGHIPQFTIITNGSDFRIKEQRNFMKWVRQSSLSKDGMNLLIETDQTAGHAVLPKHYLVPFVQP
ncbi:hypothetical protein [Corynebacterium aurimucosum]|uniref:hypothetical protein n=1 Tax=Corynebacterium aurimucosum TaxID=169292 RepID=UPI003756C56C